MDIKCLRRLSSRTKRMPYRRQNQKVLAKGVLVAGDEKRPGADAPKGTAKQHFI